MANDDRYGDRDRERGNWRSSGDYERDRSREGGDQDRGFFERAGEGVRSWFGGSGDDQDRGSYGRQGEQDYDRGYGRDPRDRSPGSHTDYYRGGDRGQSRMGPEGGFESRGDYRRSDRYSEQGQSGGGESRFSEHGHGGSQSGSFSGSGGVNQSMGNYGESRGEYGSGGGGAGATDPVFHGGGGAAGPGFDPNFAAGPRFDRADVGHVGTHGAHPVASAYGQAQSDSLGGGGSSARSRAILEQHARQQQQGGQQPRSQQGSGQQGWSQQPQAQQGWSQQPQGFASGQQGSGGQHDPHYSQWRQRQIESLDQDYDEYRRENATRFEQEFGSWREKRGQQRQSLGRAREQMEVVGSDGQHLGTVDKIAGDRIILTKSDPNAGGHHHSIPCSWIENVDDKVTISKTAEQAMQAWRDEETSRALFEDKNAGSEGPHALERSFSGTYKDE